MTGSQRRVSVTASIGGAAYPEHDITLALELVESADSSPLVAKQVGRDRVMPS